MRHLRPAPSHHSSWKVTALAIALIVLIVGSIIYRAFTTSQIIGNPYRYNLVLAGDQRDALFVSFDPQEKQIFAVAYPATLEIQSRSVGTYKVGNLYALGMYDGNPATFVRRKIQGFMRVPVSGFVQDLIPPSSSPQYQSIVRRSLVRNAWAHDEKSNLSRLDSFILYMKTKQYDWHISAKDDLVRAGVIEKKNDTYTANQERLKQFLGAKVFDWALGAHRATIAVVNESGEDGLGTVIAEFLSNMGFDIVAVKGGRAESDTTEVDYPTITVQSKAILYVFKDLFGWQRTTLTPTDEYRAQYVVKVGKDAISLF